MDLSWGVFFFGVNDGENFCRGLGGLVIWGASHFGWIFLLKGLWQRMIWTFFSGFGCYWVVMIRRDIHGYMVVKLNMEPNAKKGSPILDSRFLA